MIRELANITERKVYRDDSEVELEVILAKGDVVENQTITQALATLMIEGETRIDMVSNRGATKANGKLYKQVVKDGEVVFEEII